MKRNPTATSIPRAHEAIRTRCFHPSGSFPKFAKEDLEASIPDRFERICRQYPERIAVKSESQVLTYSDLNAEANRIARQIRARLRGGAEPVGLLFNDAAHLAAAMLGVLKAGHFLMLLDSSFPKSRNEALLEDCQVCLVIADHENISLANDLIVGSRTLMEFESLDSKISADNLALRIPPGAFAAVVYTSGSTGEPKGVIWNHQDLLHRIMLRTVENEVCVHDRVALLSRGTANAVTSSFFALLNGAMLCAFEVQKEGVIRLAKWLAEERITICPFSSSLFRSFVSILHGQEMFPDLRIVRLRSETVHKSDFERFKTHFASHCVFVTGLSTSETGQLTTYLLNHDSDIPDAGVPIGYPMQDKEILLLDDSGQEVGLNRVGEIVVRSRYLAIGYWRRPELTQAKFKAVADESEQRLCFTGDLALRLPDGCLVHKGRKDFRIKIRGYGVELAEVEQCVLDHPAVKQAVVVAQRNDSSDLRLVAYYTSVSDPSPQSKQLRDFLEKKIPQYMIPAAFVLLDEMPLTSNGKVDRHALPGAGNARPDLATAYLSPRNRIEQRLVAIWEDVLDVYPIGVKDGFFDLGGDSLSATQVISQVIKHFDLEIPLQLLFQSPTIADMAVVVAEGQDKLSENDKTVHAAADSLAYRSPEDSLPLSYSQQRLWFLDQLDPGSFAYNLFSAYRLKGDLNVFTLEQSFNEIIGRHEILRTVFRFENGNPLQVVLPNLTIKIPLLDLRATPSEQDKWTEVGRMFAEEARRPFDLSTGPLLRITVLQLADNDHVLLRAMHHIVFDGWSQGVLFRELSEIYAALTMATPSPLADLPTQYGDYAKWQRQWFEAERLESQLSYWKKQLANIATLELPTDYPRQDNQTPRGERRYFLFSDALCSELKKLSRQHGATLFMTLLAAFQTLLYRYSNQTDIAIGSPVAGRSRKEFEELVGLFVNMLVLRLDLSGNPTFAGTIARAREVCLAALSNQELSFEKLVEELHPDRHPGRNPLFQVSFAFQNTPRVQPRLLGITVEELEVETGIARFDLHLFMEEMDGHLKGYCDYNTNLFNADTIERMLGHFQTLLQGIVANPEQRIADLPLLSEAEKHQLLVESNDTPIQYPKDHCIHELFESQVEKSSDAIAVIFEEQQLTYRELNNRANQLAHYLRKLGVGPEVLVGICVERSLEMIVGILAILKAGGAYLPLDPSYPKERLTFMLEDSRAAILITQSALIERLPADQTTVLCLDRDWGEISTGSQDNPPPLTTPDNLAYVIYTSGSTGAPKGALIPHHNVVRLFRATGSWFHFSAADVWTLFHSYAFDFSVWEIWGALVHGGRLVVVPLEVSRSAQEFYQLLCREQVTVLNQTPAAFRQLVQAEEAIIDTGCLGLRLIVLGGEALDFASLKPWFDRHGDQRPQLINMYGITESTVHVTYKVIKEADLTASGPSLIGAPIPDLELYVLDSYRNLVPIGVAGELYVGGAGLARGYLNRDKLTAERFVGHLFDDGKVRRLFRSGDLARRRINGEIEYLGRIDQQVKVRGYRIELGEIEAMLTQHPGIQQAVVLAREDTPGDKRLVAYIVTATGSAIAPNDLRRYLQQKLPEYMVPSTFAFLDSLPVTPNGKLDRQALPAPDQSRPELDQTYRFPRTIVEEILANIWAVVLKVDHVGVHDDFFQLGGHSLLATQVISRINTAFQIALPLRRLFESPTIAGLAHSIQTGREIQNHPRRAQAIVPIARSKDMPLSFAQERLWFLDRLDPDNATYNVPAAFRLTGDLNVNALEQSLNEIVRRHQSLRTIFATINGKPVQQILPSLNVSLTAMEVRDGAEKQREQAVQNLLRQEAELPFNLSDGPLIRARLWRLAPCDHLFALTLHHIVSDGWSMGVLFRELSVLYRAYRSGQSNPLPVLPLQYADYSIWQRNWLTGETLETQLSYWKKQLDRLPTLELPTDHSRPTVQTYRGCSQSIELPAKLYQALKSLSQREGVTLFMSLLAAFQTLLYRYCGQDDVAVGTPIAGRIRQEFEGLIGFFVNTLVLRTKFSTNPTFKELLRQVRQTTLEAYTHQDLPFEKLVEELQPERNPSVSPLFQVFFIFQNNADTPLDLEHLAVNPIRTASRFAKFDLSVTLSERHGALQASFNYNTDLYEAATIKRLLDHFQNLLESIAANPDQTISEIPVLSDAERHRVLVEWNNTNSDYPKDQGIHQLFEAQVEKSPKATAVIFEEQQLTYTELNQKANQLAHQLIKEGVQSGTAVGVYLDRSIELAVALLAVLKAGAVYVPLDPSYPSERATFILQDVQASLVMSTRSLASRLCLFDGRIITVDIESPKLDRDDNPNPRTTFGSLASVYILYTSGSTGTPKGVVMSHRALNNLISWQVNTFGRGLPARTLQFAPLGFDVSIQEMFSTWCSGGSLYFIQDTLRRDGSKLMTYIEHHSIERIFLPLVALKHFAEVAVEESRSPQSLREIVVAGEQLRLTKSLRLFLDKLENCRLHNQYGPTESHVVTQYIVDVRSKCEPELPPIGRPISNTKIYILDSHLNPVPIGVTGELFIGGIAVAQGYLNRAQLTEEKFIANPFSNDPGARLYKSGDLARYRADGNIEFLGRIDHQVKIRGYRIEPGEIETLLSQHACIQEAVVLATEETPGDKRLVAYIVTATGSAIAPNDLRRYLQQKLPEYMVPSAFVFLDFLPLTPSGKIDRQALPEPDQQQSVPKQNYIAPRTMYENIVTRIWAEVLRRPRVGADDNFFELGGHSLLATQVVSRIREALGVDLAVRTLFEKPRVANLCDHLETVRPSGKRDYFTEIDDMTETEDVIV